MSKRFRLGNWCVLLCSLQLVACSSSDEGSSSHSHNEHDHGVAAIEPGVWPPTLTNIENQQALPAPARTRGGDVVIAAARNAVRNNPAIRNLLGDNYREYEASTGNSKDDTVASFLFFSYDNNSTVDVKLANDGSLRHTVFASTDYQPTENQDEVAEAINLGTAALQSDGIDLTPLQGTAMLAFQPSEGNTPDNQHYAERVLYVTFGPGNGIEPKYWALVNLSRQSVMDSGEML